MRTITALPSLALALLLARPVHATQTETALEAFTRAHDEIEQLVQAEPQTTPKAKSKKAKSKKAKPKPKPKPKVETKKVEAKVDALIDYHFITVAALGGPSVHAERCAERYAERCAEVESLLSQLIRHNYLARLSSGPRGQVEILRQHVRPAASKVDTLVRYEDDEGTLKIAKVDYVMHRVDDRWMIRDIRTEDVSLAGNYQYEIERVYKRGGIEAVVMTLRRKLTKLRRRKR